MHVVSGDGIMLSFVDKGIFLINLRLRRTIRPDPAILTQYRLKGSVSTTVLVLPHLALAC